MLPPVNSGNTAVTIVVHPLAPTANTALAHPSLGHTLPFPPSATPTTNNPIPTATHKKLHTLTPLVPTLVSEMSPHIGAANTATSSSMKPRVPTVVPRSEGGRWNRLVRRKESEELRKTRKEIVRSGRVRR